MDFREGVEIPPPPLSHWNLNQRKGEDFRADVPDVHPIILVIHGICCFIIYILPCELNSSVNLVPGAKLWTWMLMNKRPKAFMFVQVRNSTSEKSKYDFSRPWDSLYSYLGQLTHVYSLCPWLRLELLILLPSRNCLLYILSLSSKSTPLVNASDLIRGFQYFFHMDASALSVSYPGISTWLSVLPSAQRKHVTETLWP